MSLSAARILGIGLVLATIALLFIAGCGQPVKKSDSPIAANSPSFVAPDGSTSIRVTPVGAEYAGNEACSPCHALVFKDHKNSGHNLTMHFLDKEGMGTLRRQRERLQLALMPLKKTKANSISLPPRIRRLKGFSTCRWDRETQGSLTLI